MQAFAKEFFQLTRSLEYSDLLEDTDWAGSRISKLTSSIYSDLLEDTDWK